MYHGMLQYDGITWYDGILWYDGRYYGKCMMVYTVV